MFKKLITRLALRKHKKMQEDYVVKALESFKNPKKIDIIRNPEKIDLETFKEKLHK